MAARHFNAGRWIDWSKRMPILLEDYPIPDSGAFEIRTTVQVNVTAEQARRKVDTWLLLEVSMMMGAESPTLVVGERTLWRVPARFTAPHVGRVGTVGQVDVDAGSGELYDLAAAKEAILCRAKELAKTLPPFRVKETPPEYLATHLQPTHQPGRPVGSPFDVLD
jgi:hypothetical protein